LLVRRGKSRQQQASADADEPGRASDGRSSCLRTGGCKRLADANAEGVELASPCLPWPHAASSATRLARLGLIGKMHRSWRKQVLPLVAFGRGAKAC
jgi:hypothetical protein